MNLRRYIFLPIFLILASAMADAKIASWAVIPGYVDELNRYYGDFFVFSRNGKWGLVRSPGSHLILQADFDFFIPFTNGYALACINQGDRYVVSCIVGEDGSVTKLTSVYYLPAHCRYVSEGKLAVRNAAGKYGYISTTGDLVIKCQFDDALPFKEGFAPVKQGNYIKYITANYDQNPSRSVLAVDFHYGEMTQASCFKDGSAAVRYNNDFALIDTNGRKIRKLSETEFQQIRKGNNASGATSYNGYSVGNSIYAFSENGKQGLKLGDEVVVLPQFDEITMRFIDNLFIVAKDGKYGVLQLSDGDVSISTSVKGRSDNTIEFDSKGNVTPVALKVSSTSAVNDLKLYVDTGTGQFSDMSEQLYSSANGEVAITPVINNEAQYCTIRARVEGNGAYRTGILLAEQSKQFDVIYPVKLRVSAPGPSTIRANADGVATFSSTIFNDSGREVTITATWSTGKSVTKTIPAHGRVTIFDSVSVSSNYSKTISVSLSTGDSASSTIYFEPFF